MLKLIRLSTSKHGTFGVIMQEGVPIPICVTLEPPWLDNKPNESCIPERVYKCVPHSGTKYKDVWRLEDVPGREAILIHPLNYLRQTQGCIGVGKSFWITNGSYAIKDSLVTIQMLRSILPKEFHLEILNAF